MKIKDKEVNRCSFSFKRIIICLLGSSLSSIRFQCRHLLSQLERKGSIEISNKCHYLMTTDTQRHQECILFLSMIDICVKLCLSIFETWSFNLRDWNLIGRWVWSIFPSYSFCWLNFGTCLLYIFGPKVYLDIILINFSFLSITWRGGRVDWTT